VATLARAVERLRD